MIKIIAVGFGSLVYIWASGDKGGRFGALYHSLLPANPIILHYPDRPLWNFLNFGFCHKGGVGGCLSEQWMVLWAVSVVVERWSRRLPVLLVVAAMMTTVHAADGGPQEDQMGSTNLGAASCGQQGSTSSAILIVITWLISNQHIIAGL